MPGTHTEFPSSDFAITSVNVGDRLDQREIDDRKQQDDASFYARRRWGASLRSLFRRLLPLLLVLGLLGLAATWVMDRREVLSADRIARQLSSAMHIQVQVQDSRLRTIPAPALVLTGVDLGGQIRLDEVDLQFTAPSLWQAVMAGQRRWGDVVISPTTLSFDQSKQLLTWLGTLDHVVPDSVTRIRIAQLRFSEGGLLPDHYEAIARRDSSGQFTAVTLRRLDPPGNMQVQITPDRAGGPMAFQCDASDWQPTFAPHVRWSEMLASGHASADSIVVDKFTLSSSFGGIEGALTLRRIGQGAGAATWSTEGQVKSLGVDIPTLIQQIVNPGGPTPDPADIPAGPISGTAGVEAIVRGNGSTPDEALSRLVAAGDIKVRSATLNGINLGYAASRPSSVSSVSSVSPSNTAATRFTKLDASFVAGASGVMFRNVHGVAGALSTGGEVAVTPELAVDGILHVHLGAGRVQAPLRLHIRGTVDHPQFGR